jgi:hypothetical protein
MPNVIRFAASPLAPFVGRWVRDPLSVSRNKVVKRMLGADGLKKLWACDSIQDRTECLANEKALAEKYQALLRLAGLGNESHLEVTLQTITFNDAAPASSPAKSSMPSVYQVAGVTAEGKKVVVESIDQGVERHGRRIGYALRMNKNWLLVSERYYGTRAQLFPRSPVFRYSRLL